MFMLWVIYWLLFGGYFRSPLATGKGATRSNFVDSPYNTSGPSLTGVLRAYFCSNLGGTLTAVGTVCLRVWTAQQRRSEDGRCNPGRFPRNAPGDARKPFDPCT